MLVIRLLIIVITKNNRLKLDKSVQMECIIIIKVMVKN